jgi:glutamine synthetase
MHLQEKLNHIPADSLTAAQYYSEEVTPAMTELRKDADILEELTDKTCWPYPTYSDLLFY